MAKSKEKIKVMTILGTRPEIIRLSEVIKKCDGYFDHILVHTGQNWDTQLKDVFFKDLGLKPPVHYLNCVGKNLGDTMGSIIAKTYDVLLKEKPDALLVLGDTNSALSAIAAKRLKIPIFHMEAGNRCFDQNVPEEINRKIVDHISDINLPYTEHSRRYLLSEGFRKEHIFVTGSPMKEVLEKNLPQIKKSKILNTLKLKEKKYIVISAHREENIDIRSKFNELIKSINAVAEKYKMPIIYSVHPRSRKMIEKQKVKFHKLVKLCEPFGLLDYINLQMNSFCVLSDSGTLSEESAILGFPAVLIRTSTERPEAIEKGMVVIGGVKSNDVLLSMDIATTINKENKGDKELTSSIGCNIPEDYKETNISDKVVRIISSYYKIINKVVWDKD